MENKKTILGNVWMNGDNISELRRDMTQESWEGQINLQLSQLYNTPPFQSSKAVLNELRDSGRKVLLVPAQRGEASAEPVISIEWPARAKSNWPAATREGAPPLYCADGSVDGRDKTGTPMVRDGPPGTGSGSDVVIHITPLDHVLSLAIPGDWPDEVLLHECVHALRMQKGKNLCLGLDEGYDTVEEFYAILIANIYRSECRRRELRAHHGPKVPLRAPLTNEGAFYARWKAEIDQLVKEMPQLCKALAAVRCAFNPIRQAPQVR
jgi:hypothetical protein